MYFLEPSSSPPQKNKIVYQLSCIDHIIITRYIFDSILDHFFIVCDTCNIPNNNMNYIFITINNFLNVGTNGYTPIMQTPLKGACILGLLQLMASVLG